jgi:hypothetical protein
VRIARGHPAGPDGHVAGAARLQQLHARRQRLAEGARRAGTSAGYVAALSVLTGIAVCGTAWVRRGGPQLAQALRAGWARGLVGGLLMLLAYVFVVHAMTLAPMAPSLAQMALPMQSLSMPPRRQQSSRRSRGRSRECRFAAR